MNAPTKTNERLFIAAALAFVVVGFFAPHSTWRDTLLFGMILLLKTRTAS